MAEKRLKKPYNPIIRPRCAPGLSCLNSQPYMSHFAVGASFIGLSDLAGFCGLGGHLGGHLGGQVFGHIKRKVFVRGTFRGTNLRKKSSIAI